MDAVFNFLASQNGRYARIVAGIALVLIGLLVGDTPGWILVIVGLVPLLAGVFDVCVFAPLFGLAFKGTDLRAALRKRRGKNRR